MCVSLFVTTYYNYIDDHFIIQIEYVSHFFKGNTINYNNQLIMTVTI